MPQLDFQPTVDNSNSQPSQAQAPDMSMAPNQPSQTVVAQPKTDNPGKLDFQPMLDFQPIGGQSDSSPAFLPNENKVVADQYARPDSVQVLQKELGTNWDPRTNPIKSQLQPVVEGLKAATIPFQRTEAAIANVGMEAQKGNTNPYDYLDAAAQGIMGQRQGELGDLVRTTGFGGKANEPIAATVGFAGAVPAWNVVGSGIDKAVEGVSKGSAMLSDKLMYEYLHPKDKNLLYGKSPENVPAQEGIRAPNAESLLAQMEARKQSVGSLIGATRSDAPVKVNISPAVDIIDNQISKLQEDNPREMSGLITRLQDKKADLLHETTDDEGNVTHTDDLTNLGLADAHDFRDRATSTATKSVFSMKPNEDDIYNETMRDVYRAVTTKMNAAAPELIPLNERYGNLKSAVDSLTARMNVTNRNTGIMGDAISAGIGSLGGAAAHLAAPPAGLAAIVGHRLMQTALFKTNMSIALHDVSTGLESAQDFAHTFLNIPQDIKQSILDSSPTIRNNIAKIFKGSPPDSFTPEVMGGKALPYYPKVGINRALPSPVNAGQSSGPVINQEGYVPPGLPEGASESARSGVTPPAGKGLPSPRTAGQSSGPVINQPAQEGQVIPPQKLLPKPETTYGDGFTMKKYSPQPIQINDSDRQDLADMLDWTAHQQNGERYSFINSEGQRQFSGTPSSHAESVQEVGPQQSIHIMQKALLNKPMTPMQVLKVNKMLKDFQTNIKPKMKAEAPGMELESDGPAKGNTDNPEPQKPLGSDLGSNKGSVNSSVVVAGAGALATGAALGAKNAKAAQPDAQDRLNLPPAQYTKREEGFRGSVYKDTTGHKTVGYGFNLDDASIRRMIPNDVLSGKRELTTREADSVFSKAYSKAQDDARAFVGTSTWGKLSPSQHKALVDMSYNLGSGKLSGFGHMKQALQSGNWQKASAEVLKSNYAKEVPNRAHRNSQLINRNV